MQRINWFPDPNITGTAPIGVANVKVNYPIVNGRKWMRATSTATGDAHAEYALSGSQIPPAGSYHVHALAYAQKAEAHFLVFVRVGGSYTQTLNVPVGDCQTVTVDRTITIPAGCSQLIVRIGPNGQTVGAIGMMGDILIERADTYDAAVGGGASGLLRGGHDATRLTPAVGVVSDDGNELAPASESGHPTHNMERSVRHREQGRNPNLPGAWRQWHFESFFENVRWHVQSWTAHLRRQVPGEAHESRRVWCHRRAQRRKGWSLGVPASHGRPLVTVFRLAIRRADPDRVGDLHARRLGEIAVNGSDVLRRGYDAARLTLMGVTA